MNQPAATTPLEIEIYQFHILLLKISPAIWRRVQVRSDSTLAHLHQIIQLSMGWQDEHLHRFAIHVHHYAVTKPSGGWDADEAEGVQLKDLRLRKGERFVYQYDFGANWLHQIRLEQSFVLGKPGARWYPFCSGGSRIAPPEGCGGANPFMDLEPHLHAQIWQAQVRLAQITSQLVEVLDRNDVGEIGLFRQTHRAELTALLPQLKAAKFDRTALNQQLQQLGEKQSQSKHEEKEKQLSPWEQSFEN